MTTHPRPKPAALLVTLASATSFAEHYHAHPLFSSFLVFLAAFFSFLFIRIIYRLTLHPLARFPGPKLGAITHWYGGWYNLFGNGSFVFIFPELFEKYGPIVRIYPDELIVKDIASYNEAFKIGGKYIKEPAFYEHPILSESLLCIKDNRAARERRDALGPYFSKASIRQLEPVIRSKVAYFLQRADEFLRSPAEKQLSTNPKAGSRKAEQLNLSRAYRCLTADIITKYSYDKSFGALDDHDFFPMFLQGFESTARTGWLEFYFHTLMSFVITTARKLPMGVLRVLIPELWQMCEFEDQCRRQVLALKSNPDPPPNIFERLLNPEPKSPILARAQTFPSYKAPASPTLSTKREIPSDEILTSEALLMVAAGMDTTGHTLTMGTYYILKNPDKQARLLEELKTVMPTVEGAEEISIEKLENLPYLGAVIRETLRITCGLPGPLPRVVPRAGTKINGRDIPGGTSIGHAHYIYHYDPRVFPDPQAWKPERWLEATPEMNSHFMPFSKGSRQCLGMNLAWAELFHVVATVFRRYELSLTETADEDMQWRDYYVPVTNGYLRVDVDGIRND